VSTRKWSGRRLAEARELAAPWLREAKFDLLRPPPQDLNEPAVTSDEVLEELSEISRRLQALHNIAPLLYRSQITVVTATDAELETVAAQQYQLLKNATFSDSQPIFPNLTATWVSIDHCVYARYRLPAILLRFEQDPDLVRRISNGTARAGSEEQFFASNQAIAGVGLLNDTYLGPLLACAAPDIWAVHAQRLGNTVIYTLGRSISGVDRMPAEPLQLLPRQAPVEFRDRVEPTEPRAWADALSWWTTKLDQMLAYLSDPATFKDLDGYYLPYHHQNWMLNAEEFFNRTSSAAMAWRDTYSGQISTYTALDIVAEGFLGSDMSALCNPKRASKALEALQNSIPSLAQQVLLPRARGAVEALHKIADGFFIQKSQRSDTVDIVHEDGKIEHLNIGSAVSALMRGRRNATHGFGGKRDKAARAARILAHHDGTLPTNLQFLPYLYLLEVLNEPEKSRRRIVAQSQNFDRN
jgi:hypothetical protein